MRIPQELVDEIISEFDLSKGYDPGSAEILKSCALVSRSFATRCQARLFARISVRDYGRDIGPRDAILAHTISAKLSKRLSALLSRSPHLANYIRILDLCYNSGMREASFIPQILSAVTALTSLTLANRHDFGGFFPVSSFAVGAFSLPSLRRVELSGYQFRNVFDLEFFLSKAKCLKGLTLREIDFDDFQPVDIESFPPWESTLGEMKLETLCLDKLHRTVVTSMLHSFTKVDMRHLKSLCIRNSPLTEFLRANSRSLHKLKIGSSPGSTFELSDGDVPDPQILAGGNCLNSIDFEADDLNSILTFVPLLGDLHNLTTLKTIRITLQHKLSRAHTSKNAEWDRLDQLLESLPTGIRVDIYAAFDRHATVMDAPDVDAIKNRLPMLGNRGALHVYQNPRAHIYLNMLGGNGRIIMGR
ncbi:hypothetical protein MSAN_00754500 [Mycena sanguinolenta]|uniref:F-box domain-containing protein n=1 Tax=Mycena sanguinolenta TaxID=230812 RepID=A0A8H6Z226_9AGAR|nr:hypothetical protein MSAN_00754500 [Mycena sanguinolenta]